MKYIFADLEQRDRARCFVARKFVNLAAGILRDDVCPTDHPCFPATLKAPGVGFAHAKVDVQHKGPRMVQAKIPPDKIDGLFRLDREQPLYLGLARRTADKSEAGLQCAGAIC